MRRISLRDWVNTQERWKLAYTFFCHF
ncbi:UNVERIFIED_CONTAM: hypothetical protein GTU68_032065 [Idotea baltica]|nr:hypothetical protein [Idotea baltica]